MKHPWLIWIGFASCLAVVLAAMGWMSLAALELDRAGSSASRQKDEALAQRDEALRQRDVALELESEARRQEAAARRRAVWEEKVRLSLWRMDSLLAPFVAQESARPYFAYLAFLPVDRAYSAMFNDRGGGERLMPSPLLWEASPNILVHFQFDPDGQLTSPQVPPPANYDLAVPQYVAARKVTDTRSHLKRVEALVDREKLLTMLPQNSPQSAPMLTNPLWQTPEQRLAEQKQRQSDLENFGRGVLEFRQRNQAFINNSNTLIGQNGLINRFNNLSLPATDVRGVLMSPLWIDGQLVLARRIAVRGREYVQGCLLDWPAIEATLLESVDDLLPEAGLAPAAIGAEEEACMLAALPVRLIPGQAVVDDAGGGGSTAVGPILGRVPASFTTAGPDGFPSPTGLSLGIAWGCVLLAAAAVAALLWGVIRLSQRRASFVTAVTHELRTPLTTFQMYAEMLAEDMVSDDRQRKEYLQTLRAEAMRLTHLVENVLAYARLERGRADGRLEAIAADQLIEAVRDRLAGRAREAGMELVVQRGEDFDGAMVRANASAAEQILLNLVDNSCKYASAASDKRIHLTLGGNGAGVEVGVVDHGPGVSAAAGRRLFRPFSKSAHEAAHTAPGVGLGLALSRRLARDMGGDLRLEQNAAAGARFVLTLASAGRSGSDG